MASVYKPSGRRLYMIEYKDQLGQTKKATTGMMDRRAAEGLAALVERDAERLRAGLLPERPTITGSYLGLEEAKIKETLLSELLKTYLADLERQGMSPATVKHRRKQLGLLFRKNCWRAIVDITPGQITGALAAMTQAGRAVSTTNAYRETLSAFLSWCIPQGYITENPVRKVKAAKTSGAARPRQRRAFKPEELRSFVNRHEGYRDYYLTAALTGLRLQELSLVERRDFDLEKRVWTCRAEVDKMNTVHRLPILPDLLPILERVCRGKKPAERLFAEQQSNATFNRHLLKAGLAKVGPDGHRLSFHSLRYTFCTLLAGKLPLKTVQKLMRHSSLKHTADLYLQLELDSLLDQTIDLPPLFNPEPQELSEQPR